MDTDIAEITPQAQVARSSDLYDDCATPENLRPSQSEKKLQLAGKPELRTWPLPSQMYLAASMQNHG